jgi:hypothetical protein
MSLPPFVLVRCLRCYSHGSISASRLVAHGSRRIYTPKYLSPNDLLGPITDLGNEDGPDGLLNKKKKGKKNKDSNKNVKSGLRADGLGNTDADLRSADNQWPSKLPAKRFGYTYTALIKWCDGFICCILST